MASYSMFTGQSGMLILDKALGHSALIQVEDSFAHFQREIIFLEVCRLSERPVSLNRTLRNYDDAFGDVARVYIYDKNLNPS